MSNRLVPLAAICLPESICRFNVTSYMLHIEVITQIEGETMHRDALLQYFDCR